MHLKSVVFAGGILPIILSMIMREEEDVLGKPTN